MKYRYIYLLMIGLFAMACNKEWEEELFEKDVSFVNNGVVPVYAKYRATGGAVTLKVPVVLSGSTTNTEEIQVTLDMDNDTLQTLNFERFRNRQDLYFLQLPQANYSFSSNTATIPGNSNVGYFDLNLKMENLDMYYKYLLPVKLVSTSKYSVSPRRWYKKSLMQIIPFNDYSGRYSVPGEVKRTGGDDPALSTPYRNAWVVDEKTVFFYAGVIEEEAYDRLKYKLLARFNEDGTITLTATDPAIKFSQNSGTYTIEKKKDEVQPYLERTITTMNLNYEYEDVTNPAFPLRYRFTGAMVLDRARNTQIPDEDQQVIINNDVF
ncbi:DUF4973 domain-containing protein [Niabella beijingensis]|uniref:DUF4973 domain-containing protein n=1 Tax=Niabella beijingensis TaxID=2872700 RepID=UPI001CBDE524|nr:DUF4973 domain-containing protein [Niabella beijingensis]MBZ4191698.1 DUF4973 domain-containing protein [Niabella beijingensis]